MLQPTRSEIIRSTAGTVQSKMTAIRDWFAASTHWTIVASFASGADGFIMRQTAGADTTTRYAFIRSGNNLQQRIDPSGTMSLVNMSDAGAGSSAIQTVTSFLSDATHFTCQEWVDAFVVFAGSFPTPSAPIHKYVAHSGYIHVPHYLSDLADGITGLASVSGLNAVQNGAGYAWVSGAATATPSTVRTASGTWQTIYGLFNTSVASGTHTPTAGAQEIGGRRQPIACYCAIKNFGRRIGIYKYQFVDPTAATTGAVLTVGTVAKFFYSRDTGAASANNIWPCVDNFDPTDSAGATVYA